MSNGWVDDNNEVFMKAPPEEEIKTIYQLADDTGAKNEPRLSIDDLTDLRCNYCDKPVKRGSSHYTNRRRDDHIIHYTGVFCTLRCWDGFVYDLQ